jgi:hypothetical protein
MFLAAFVVVVEHNTENIPTKFAGYYYDLTTIKKRLASLTNKALELDSFYRGINMPFAIIEPIHAANKKTPDFKYYKVNKYFCDLFEISEDRLL